MWKALVRALEMFREEGPKTKRMFAATLAMGISQLWALGIVTRVEAKVKVVVGCFVGDEEVPRVGARDGMGEGAQVEEAAGYLVVE